MRVWPNVLYGGEFTRVGVTQTVYRNLNPVIQ